MTRRLVNLFSAAALIFAIGFHWLILQSVAWTGMIIIYSQTMPLAEAVTRTFDGRHPCKLCQVVQAGKRSEQKQSPQFKLPGKLDFFCNPEVLIVMPIPHQSEPTYRSAFRPLRAEPPATPPPRFS